MPRCRARLITLTACERRRLKKIATSHTAGYQLVVRIRIVLDAAHGYSSNTIAQRRGVTVDTVRLWRGRYRSEEGVNSLTDRVGAPGPACLDVGGARPEVHDGGAAVVDAQRRATVIALADDVPEGLGDGGETRFQHGQGLPTYRASIRPRTRKSPPSSSSEPRLGT
ncbi:helix-turn-helix domain-containing protein [Nonomuraea sp. NPDC050643]|uniref:helix-turn-helix domain-containing protein n=1 Tax=Nonomuraea sp. NPDC050643 TaxID=3155660 RepID=UPI0033D7A18B